MSKFYLVFTMVFIPLVLFAEPLTNQQMLSLRGPTSQLKPVDRLDSAYAFDNEINPFNLRGDFDGHNKPDGAVFIREVADQTRYGIAIFHGGKEEVVILGAGNEFGNGGFDFRWMDI